MSNASTKDAEAGFKYYLTLEEPTPEAVNKWLRQHLHAPVSNRTYLHYEKLVRNGHKTYMSVGMLDVLVQQERDAKRRNLQP